MYQNILENSIENLLYYDFKSVDFKDKELRDNWRKKISTRQVLYKAVT